MLANEQIEDHVNTIVNGFLKNTIRGSKSPTADEQQIIDSFASLVVNFLQNLNDLAFVAIEQWESEREQ
jgi:hypothetical protein